MIRIVRATAVLVHEVEIQIVNHVTLLVLLNGSEPASGLWSISSVVTVLLVSRTSSGLDGSNVILHVFVIARVSNSLVLLIDVVAHVSILITIRLIEGLSSLIHVSGLLVLSVVEHSIVLRIGSASSRGGNTSDVSSVRTFSFHGLGH